MNNKSRWVRDSVYSLCRVRDSYEDRGKMYRMDRNERTWNIPDTILDMIRERIDSDILTNYTEIDETYRVLADFLGVRNEQVYFHSGSDLVIKSVFETYIEPGDSLLLQNPSYAMYGVYAHMFGAELYEYDFEENLSFDLDGYCEYLKEIRPKMAVIENPGGYIGNSFTFEQIWNFVDIASKYNVLVVVDEAYIDFIPKSSAIDLLTNYNNLIVVRTFSKAWGLAGLRAGYAISNETIISELFKVRPMHELTSFTAMVVEMMIEQSSEVKLYVEDVIRVREYFCEELDKLDIKYAKSDTHFVTLCIGSIFDMTDFRRRAHENSFYVRRPFTQESLKDWVRIGLLPMKEMKDFVYFIADYKGKYAI